MWYDILTVAILGYSTLRGAMKGIVWQLAVIAAIVLCFAFSDPLSLKVSPYIPVDPPLNRWLTMLCLYLGFSFVSFIVARQLRDWIEKARFVEYDRHIGALFGFCKGVIICMVLTFFVVTLSEDARGQILRTYSGHAAAVIMDRLHPVMPAELHEVLAPYIHQLDQPDLDLQHAHEESGETSAANEGAQAREMRDRQGGGLQLPVVQDAAVGVPGLARRGTIEWQAGKPSAAPARLDSERTKLMREIAAVLADVPDTQNAIVEEIEIVLVFCLNNLT